MRPPYCIRRNPATGRWIMYFWDRWADRPHYRIMGGADSMATAVAAVFK